MVIFQCVYSLCLYVQSLDGLAQEALDFAEEALVFLADEGDGFATLALRTFCSLGYA